MKQYNIYVGLNDSVTHRQMFSTEKYITILKKVCQSYHVRFSFSVIQGGYMWDDGNAEEETTLHISLLDLPAEKVKDIAEDLCTFFNQENVMITEESVKMYYLNGEQQVKEAMSLLHQPERD